MKKIVLFGTGKIAIDTHQFLISHGYDILAIQDPQDKGVDGRKLSFGKYLREKKIRFEKPASFESSAFINKLEKFNPTIMLSMQCAQIIKPEIIKIVKGEIFNLHFSLLPKNRGVYPVYWHIKNGDKYCGVTLHKLDPGIDTGDIVDQTKRRIFLKDSARNIYQWCEVVGLQLLSKNINKLVGKKYSSLKQNNSDSNYYSQFSVNFADTFIDWNTDSFSVARSIQALNFPPVQRATTRYKSRTLEVLGVDTIEKSIRRSLPGTILNARYNSLKFSIVKIQTRDGSVSVKLIRLPYKRGEVFYL